MKMFLTGLLFVILLLALDANAQFKPSEQQYLEQTNLAFNSGFEQGLRNWTNANGVFSVDSTNFVLGKKSGKVALTAQTLDFSQTLSTGYNTALSGLQGHVAAYAKADFPFQVCALIDGVESNCVNGSGDNKFDFYDIPIVLGSTSLGIKFKSLTSYTGAIYVDGVEYGHKQFVSNVAQSEYLGRVEYSGAASCVWSTTSTTFTNYSAVTACNTPTAISGSTIQAPSTKIPAVVLPAGSPAGTYKFISSGFHYKDIATNYGAYRFSDGVNHSQESGIYANTQTIGTVLGEITYNGVLTSDTIINLQARNNSGEIEVYSNIQSPIYSISVYYHPPQSQIVRQSQELNEDNVNEYNVVFTWSGSAWIESTKDFNPIDNFSVNTPSAWTANFKSGLFTVAPAIDCTTQANQGSVTETTVFNISTTSFQMQGYNFSGGGQANYPVFCTIKKQGIDFNKSQIVYGQFEQIKSGDTPIVRAQGNAGQSITGTTDIPFIEIKDNFNAWDGDSFTVPTGQGGQYLVAGSNFVSANVVAGVYIAVNGVREQIFGFHSSSSQIHPFSGVVELSEGDVLSIRLSGGTGLSNNTDFHHLHIQKIPDIESLVKNLNDNKNVKCQTKFLSANFTGVSSNIGDLTFSNLTIGKKYKFNAHFMIGENGLAGSLVIREWYVRARNGSTDLGNVRLRFDSQGYVRETRGLTKQFTATEDNLVFFQIYNQNTLTEGSVSGLATYVELCELPDNYIEGSF